jgi:hypothetical protein
MGVNIVFLILCSGLFLCFIALVPTEPENASAQLIPGQETNLSANNGSATGLDLSQQLFGGESLRIFNVWNFQAERLWAPIDSLATDGYEIKAVIPLFEKERYVVILEKEPMNP